MYVTSFLPSLESHYDIFQKLIDELFKTAVLSNFQNLGNIIPDITCIFDQTLQYRSTYDVIGIHSEEGIYSEEVVLAHTSLTQGIMRFWST